MKVNVYSLRKEYSLFFKDVKDKFYDYFLTFHDLHPVVTKNYVGLKHILANYKTCPTLE